jgi:hypothetical protein
MPGLEYKFRLRSNDNLLQMWRGRDRLRDADIQPLRDELEARGLSEEMEEIADAVTTEHPYGELPRGPETYGNLSVPFWWLRELWLRHKTKNGVALEATIESTQRTGARWRSASRAELVYRYEFEGQKYSGRIIRDFMVGTAAADSLAYDHHPGDKIQIIVDRENPARSYASSGFGSVQPLITGILALVIWIPILLVIAVALHDRFSRF